MSITLKIVVIGSKGVGKTTICNGICDFNNPIPSEYRPTKSVRILETDQEISSDQLKNYPYLKEKDIKKVKINIWDMSGDKSIEKLWPAIKDEAHGVILVVDGKNSKYENNLDEWLNGFSLPEIKIENTICIAYHKDLVKVEKQKTSNQFPKLTIFETNYDLNNILPMFHQFVDRILTQLK